MFVFIVAFRNKYNSFIWRQKCFIDLLKVKRVFQRSLSEIGHVYDYIYYQIWNSSWITRYCTTSYCKNFWYFSSFITSTLRWCNGVELWSRQREVGCSNPSRDSPSRKTGSDSSTAKRSAIGVSVIINGYHVSQEVLNSSFIDKRFFLIGKLILQYNN